MTNKETRIKNNEFILTEISKEKPNILKQDVQKLYTGKGGLHSLDRSEFPNYWEYSRAKKIEELGQFFTPIETAQNLHKCFQILPSYKVCDMAAGTGNLLAGLTCKLYANELDEDTYNVCKYILPGAKIENTNFEYYEPAANFEIIFGNPPFNFSVKDEEDNFQLSQMLYIERAAKYLKPNGFLCVIVPAHFLTDGFFEKTRIEKINKNFSFICQSLLSENTFSANISTKVMVFQKTGTCSVNSFDPLKYIPYDQISAVVLPLSIQFNKDAAKLRLFENRAAFSNDQQTGAKILKLLYEIKIQKNLKEKFYSKAVEKLETFKTQTRPAGMDWDTWNKEKIKESDILNLFKKWVKGQNQERKINTAEPFSTKYTYGINAAGPLQDIKKLGFEKKIFESVTDPICAPVLDAHKKVIERKRKDYKIHSLPFSKMERNTKIDQFLNEFTLHDFEGSDPAIHLNEMQKNDLGLCFQKRYSILQWQQGSGKSVAGMAWISFLQDKVKNTVILAPAVAASLTWEPRLKKHGFDFKVIKKVKDIQKIKPGQILLISFNQVTKLKSELQEFCKIKSQKIALLVDESDELTNYDSNRTRATLAAFRRCSYKLLTTGTTTRNNINELYAQLELLYNNSYNFINNCDKKYFLGRNGDYEGKNNTRQFEPFPARFGNSDFRYCFSPRKSSVFGIEKDTQDVFNTDHLKEILARTIITRTFEQITGEKKYIIKNHSILQGAAERDIYLKIINEFYTMCDNYYKSTGNSKKDSMLRLIRQIQLLIKSTSTPHLFVEYAGGKELPHKYYKIFDLLNLWENEKVAIGTVYKEAGQDYYSKITAKYPNRQVFYIDGSTTFNARKAILKEFEATNNGILVSTQQSLKSSVNIPTCDKCIIESLQWNIPKISQYYFRFIRFDSKNKKEVHFINYADTIETNILALLMAKEKLNNFIKTLDMQDRADIYQDFDIDINILDCVVRKEEDKDGKMQLSWGKQNLSN